MLNVARRVAGVELDAALAQPAADPPPPEDALLARIDQILAVPPPMGKMWESIRVVLETLQSARDRIAADAIALRDVRAAWIERGMDLESYPRRLAAAEARAQGLEAALRDIASANYAGPGYRIAGDRGEEADDFAERLQNMARAVLAQSPDSGKIEPPQACNCYERHTTAWVCPTHGSCDQQPEPSGKIE